MKVRWRVCDLRMTSMRLMQEVPTFVASLLEYYAMLAHAGVHHSGQPAGVLAAKFAEDFDTDSNYGVVAILQKPKSPCGLFPARRCVVILSEKFMGCKGVVITDSAVVETGTVMVMGVRSPFQSNSVFCIKASVDDLLPTRHKSPALFIDDTDMLEALRQWSVQHPQHWLFTPLTGVNDD